MNLKNVSINSSKKCRLNLKIPYLSGWIKANALIYVCEFTNDTITFIDIFRKQIWMWSLVVFVRRIITYLQKKKNLQICIMTVERTFLPEKKATTKIGWIEMLLIRSDLFSNCSLIMPINCIYKYIIERYVVQSRTFSLDLQRR